MRTLYAGEELTDMYTVHWTEWPTQSRRDYLQVCLLKYTSFLPLTLSYSSKINGY
jgi:hypothetical protein